VRVSRICRFLFSTAISVLSSGSPRQASGPIERLSFDVHLNVALDLVIELPVLALPNLRINSRNRFIEVPHSHLSASIGWTRAARRAGIKHARAATAKSTREATTTVGIKCGWKP